VNPILGQWFRNETEVVISNAFWRRLGSDSAIVGKPVTMDGRSYTIAGVMAPAFRLPVAGLRSAGARTDVWLLLEHENVGAFYFAYARRKPDISFVAAEADAKRVATEIAAANPSGREAYTAHVYDLRETVGEADPPDAAAVVRGRGAAVLDHVRECRRPVACPFGGRCEAAGC
jgi:hypothetical protein